MKYGKLDRKQFGKRFQECRRRKYSSVEKFVDQHPEIKTEADTVKRWEQGRAFPRNTNDLLAACDALDVDVDYLLGKQKKRTKEITDIAAETGLSEESIEWLKGSVNAGPYQGAHDFIDYALSHGLFDVAKSVDNIYRRDQSMDETLFWLLPEQIKTIVDDSILPFDPDREATGLFNLDERAIAERLCDLVGQDEALRQQILKRCNTIRKSGEYDLLKKNIPDVIDYLELYGIAEDVARLRLPAVSDSVADEITLIYNTTCICSHLHAIRKALEPSERFSITEKFNDIIRAYLSGKAQKGE
jgi:transcriptional regulator with XRE-family HTH domain